MVRRLIAIALLALCFTVNAEASGLGKLVRIKHGGASAPVVGVITQGAGWGGATAQPANQGNPGDFGYADPAVAYWDQPQYITATGDVRIGVWADHANAVARVDIACEGGAWVSISSPTTNPDAPGNNVPATYNAILRASGFTDKALNDCRAIVWPTTGKPLVLQGAWDTAVQASVRPVGIQSLWVNTNAGGGLWGPNSVGGFRYVASTGVDTGTCGLTAIAPCATLYNALRAAAAVAPAGDVGGTVLCLQEGSGYSLGGGSGNFINRSATQYVTVQPCTGASPANIHFAIDPNNNDLRTDRGHYKDLILTSTLGGPNIGFNCGNIDGTGATAPVIWLDHISYSGPGYTTNSGAIGNGCTGGRFVTNSDISHSGDGLSSVFTDRGNFIHDIGGDSVSNSFWTLGLTVYNVDTSYHATGDSVAGSPIISNISDRSQMFPGSTILTPAIYDGIPSNPATILCVSGTGACASDPANSLRITVNAPGTAVGQSLETGSHGDVFQTNLCTNDGHGGNCGSDVRRNVGFVNVTATDRITAQGQFLSFGNLSDYATVNVNLNNQNPNANTERVWLYSGKMDNSFVKNSTYVGGMNYEGPPGDFNTTGFSWINSTFSSCPISLNTSPVSPPVVSLSGITRANPAVVTTATAHGLLTGDGVKMNTSGSGMIQVNGQSYKVIVLSTTTFSLQTIAGVGVDSTGFTAYTSGGSLQGPLSPHGVRYINTTPSCY